MPSQTSSKELIRGILLDGTPEDKRLVFLFNKDTPEDKLLLKFKLFAKSNLTRYLKGKGAGFHDEMVRNLIKSYRGENYINLAFRGSSKTTLAKLFLVYVLLNDEDTFKKYIKILSRDIKNPKQIVTDIYNMCLELSYIYGDVFEKEGDKKREETMGSFTMKKGVKVTAGTVGQTQRGNIQDAYRPDWLLFDDIEDRESISSQPITEGIIARSDEAITGLAKGGSWCVLGNYISENGVIQWFMDKSNRILQVTPIISEGIPTWDMFTLHDIEILKKDAEDFAGEYLCDPSKSDNKFFNIDRINEDLKRCKQPIKTEQGIKYYGGLELGHRYGVGGDTSEGIGKDSNALTCFNFRTGEEMASYHSNEIKPELFAYLMARVGEDFGKCLIAPEINNMSGGIVITTLKGIYENIYRFVDKRNVIERESTKLGWYTSTLTKTNAFMGFRKDYNDGLIKINNPELLKEMKMYSTNDLAETSKITRHFDLLMSAVIAWGVKDYEVQNSKTATVTNHFLQ